MRERSETERTQPAGSDESSGTGDQREEGEQDTRPHHDSVDVQEMKDLDDLPGLELLTTACQNARLLIEICDLLGLGEPKLSHVPDLIGGVACSQGLYEKALHDPPYFWERGYHPDA